MDMIQSIECVSSSDGMEDDDAMSSNLPLPLPLPLPRPFLKASAAAAIAAASIGVVPTSGAGAIPGPLIPPATSVHELLECPVCTNSMYPPIHQVSACFSFSIDSRILGWSWQFPRLRSSPR
jgi:E3 ubiquitin-protein ligase SIAH1